MEKKRPTFYETAVALQTQTHYCTDSRHVFKSGLKEYCTNSQ